MLVNVLKKSIDGESITSMVVTLSQSSYNGPETHYSTIYGEKFNRLKTKVKCAKWFKIDKTVKEIKKEIAEN